MTTANLVTPAVFSRNYESYLTQAAARNRKKPHRLTTFRSERVWKTADLLLEQYGSIPIYMAVIGSANRLRYIGILEAVELHPDERKSTTRHMLKHALPSTKSERVWNPGEGTLYVVSHLRAVSPMPFTALRKLSNQKPLDATFRYSYALVGAIPRDAMDSIPISSDIGEPSGPQRKQYVVSRIVRDSALVRDLKRMHQNRCQICGETISLTSGTRYSEGHHLKPLGKPHEGPDVASNIIIVCPNHHAMLDLGGLSITRHKLRVLRAHTLAREYVDYHNGKVIRAE